MGRFRLLLAVHLFDLYAAQSGHTIKLHSDPEASIFCLEGWQQNPWRIKLFRLDSACNDGYGSTGDISTRKSAGYHAISPK